MDGRKVEGRENGWMMLRSIVALDKVCVCSTSLYLPALVYVRQMNTRVNMSSRASYPTAHAIHLPVDFPSAPPLSSPSSHF